MNLINQGMEQFPNVPQLILKRPKILKVDDTVIREHVTIEEVHPKYKLVPKIRNSNESILSNEEIEQVANEISNFHINKNNSFQPIGSSDSST
uniref:Uncharacterized protein n=1 Tax=Panagrolaimus sp. JU765 TaxID=591449 RepID=A0AC34RQA5_9BILA